MRALVNRTGFCCLWLFYLMKSLWTHYQFNSILLYAGGRWLLHIWNVNPGNISRSKPASGHVPWALSWLARSLNVASGLCLDSLLAPFMVMGVAAEGRVERTTSPLRELRAGSRALIRQRRSCQRMFSFHTNSSRVKASAAPQWERNMPYGDSWLIPYIMSNVSHGANFSTPASAARKVMRTLVSYWSLTTFIIFSTSCYGVGQCAVFTRSGWIMSPWEP